MSNRVQITQFFFIFFFIVTFVFFIQYFTDISQNTLSFLALSLALIFFYFITIYNRVREAFLVYKSENVNVGDSTDTEAKKTDTTYDYFIGQVDCLKTTLFFISDNSKKTIKHFTSYKKQNK